MTGKIKTLVLQPDKAFWIAYLEDNPREHWVGSSPGVALGHFFDCICSKEKTIILKIVRRP